MGDEGRRRHYGIFYGLQEIPAGTGPLLVIHGNCQAESLRVLVSPHLRTVRIPPVHELTADDLPWLAKLLGRADLVMSQPIRAGYRDLRLGTAEIMELAPNAAPVIMLPVLRWSALHPFQVIVRTPLGDPPGVPYHDLRVLAAAAGSPIPEIPGPEAVRTIRENSITELRARTERHGTVAADDLFVAAGAEACQVINHPGNLVLRGVAERALARCGIRVAVADPGRVLLDSVHAPRLPETLAAQGLPVTPATVRRDWLVAGRAVPDEEIRRVQADWYAAHPEVVAAGLRRHGALLDLLRASGA
ncbi:WcbI family polysaccharide biosynthesis putative acetyltransferase [Kineococcus gynurae]|uniref:WcbI family polysaccharide biosynthesis putative acetyltransferase n=1 Tax=Kineococcus gynurae TaxID=452979 RepID=A0ABV5LNF1_9ACTN